MLTFATLGPADSNHDLVTRRYLAFRGLDDARVVLVDDFDEALVAMAAGDIDHILQVAVHPQATSTVAKAFFRHGIYVIDTFIAPSHPLAVLTRADVSQPRTLALQPATRDYADLSAWPEHIEVGSIGTISADLLAGRYDSGLTRRSLAEEHPGRFRVDLEIGTVDDPWLVYGRERVASDGAILAWPESPAARQFGKRQDR